MLNNFITYNCRGFEEIRINKLSRINCIYGPYNSGKTTVLEAISLFKPRGMYSHDPYRLILGQDGFCLKGDERYSKTLNIWKTHTMFKWNGDKLVSAINKVLNKLDIYFKLTYNSDGGKYSIVTEHKTYSVNSISRYESDIIFKLVPIYLNIKHDVYDRDDSITVLDDIETMINPLLMEKYLRAIIKYAEVTKIQVVFTTSSSLVIEILKKIQHKDMTYLLIHNKEVIEVSIDDIIEETTWKKCALNNSKGVVYNV